MNTQDELKQTQRLTLPLYNLGCSSGDALTVERILTQQSVPESVNAIRALAEIVTDGRESIRVTDETMIIRRDFLVR